MCVCVVFALYLFVKRKRKCFVKSKIHWCLLFSVPHFISLLFYVFWCYVAHAMLLLLLLLFSCWLIIVASRFIFYCVALSFCSCNFTLFFFFSVFFSMFALYVYKQTNLSFHWAKQFKQFSHSTDCHRKSKAMQCNQEEQKQKLERKNEMKR